VSDTTTAKDSVIEWLRGQALADAFYGGLMNHLADDIEGGGSTWRPFAQLDGVALAQNLPLRVAGAAHRLALAGEAPGYAIHLPTCGGDGDAEAAWPEFRTLCESGALDRGVLAPVQTNESARTATLLPGFSLVASETGLPVRLLEIGSSAGLLLNVDRYHHTYADGSTTTWGPEGSPVRLRCEGRAPVGPFDIVDRRGCDPNPLDPVVDRLLLLSFVWPTQLDRFARLEAALDVARRHPVVVDRATAAPWLTSQLTEAREGAATVVFHSVVWQYLGADEQQSAQATIEQAGAAASARSPVAWLRLEPHAEPIRGCELRLTLWPGGEERVLAMCDYHGRWIRWDPAAVEGADHG
jgi:hypothetical protein